MQGKSGMQKYMWPKRLEFECLPSTMTLICFKFYPSPPTTTHLWLPHRLGWNPHFFPGLQGHTPCPPPSPGSTPRPLPTAPFPLLTHAGKAAPVAVLPAPFLPLGFHLNVSSSERPLLTAHLWSLLLLFPPAPAPSSGKYVSLKQSHWILLTVHLSLQIPSSMKSRTFYLYEFLYTQPLARRLTHCKGSNTFAELNG